MFIKHTFDWRNWTIGLGFYKSPKKGYHTIAFVFFPFGMIMAWERKAKNATL